MKHLRKFDENHLGFDFDNTPVESRGFFYTNYQDDIDSDNFTKFAFKFLLDASNQSFDFETGKQFLLNVKNQKQKPEFLKSEEWRIFVHLFTKLAKEKNWVVRK